MRLLTLDLATSIGWAARSQSGRISHGVYRLPSTGEDVGQFLDAFEQWLSDAITTHSPERILFEAPWIGEQTSQQTARKLMCLAGMTEFICRRREVPCFECNNKSVRAHFIGNGNLKREETKRLTKAACAALGWSPKSDDDADALAMLSFAMCEWGVAAA